MVLSRFYGFKYDQNKSLSTTTAKYIWWIGTKKMKRNQSEGDRTEINLMGMIFNIMRIFPKNVRVLEAEKNSKVFHSWTITYIAERTIR